MIFNPLMPVAIIIILAVLLVAALVWCISRPLYRKMRYFRRIAIVALIIVALLNPTIRGGDAQRNMSNINVFFAVDNTGSMVAKDMNDGKRRYEQVREDVRKITELFAGSKFSIITIDYQARTVLPLVSDVNTVDSYAKAMGPRPTDFSVNSELSTLIAELNNKIDASVKNTPERKNIVFFFSDGEDNVDGGTKLSGINSDAISGGAVIGYGSVDGARLNVIDYYGNIDDDTNVRDSDHKEVTSRLDESNLNKIASAMSLKYYNRNKQKDIFKSTSNFVETDVFYSQDDTSLKTRTGLYWVFFTAAFGLLMWDFTAILGTFLSERKAAK